MTASSSSSACNTTAKAGNACRACSVMGSLYTCSGGTTCPKLKSVTCSAGTYLPAGKTSCSTCTAGYKCPGGTFTASATVTQGRTQCTAGTYAAAGKSSCSTCAAGTYSGAGASSCTVCGTNKWSNAGASSCSSCDTTDGYGNSGTTAASHAGSASCKVTCAAGTYVKTANAACTSVGTGYYRAAHTVSYGSTSTRSQCPANYRDGAAAGSQAGCKTSCDAGTYVATANAACTSVGTGYKLRQHQYPQPVSGELSRWHGGGQSGGLQDQLCGRNICKDGKCGMYICWHGILPCGAYGKLRRHQYPQPVSGELS